MAMAERRPLGVPVASTHASPAFNAAALNKSGDAEMKPTISDLKGTYTKNETPLASEKDSAMSSEESVSPTELSPTSRSISPDSLMNSGLDSLKKTTSSISSRDSTPPVGGSQLVGSGLYAKSHFAALAGKKLKPTTRVPIATGISTTIPVTGEKPKPEQPGDASLEDDVLFAIFLILYEKDPEGAGMTVKQICDTLVERHPEMAQLSSKTSNLVSAKLNAYVKRVEKGDSNLKYALSREWADASPKRMVYVYRGLLAKDFHVHVKQAMESQKSQSDSMKFASGSTSSLGSDSLEAAKQSALSKPRRQTMFDLGISRPTFSEHADQSNLFVPYSSAPVAANLTKHAAGYDSEAGEKSDSGPAPIKKFANDSDFDFDDLEVFNDTDDDSADFAIDYMKKNGKRSKSMSYLSIKKSKFVTAAAAAPRAPKTPCSHSPNAAAAAAALHAAALKAITATTEETNVVKLPKKSKCNWAHVVRSGFLTQDIGAPEDMSLSDLEKLFN